MKISSVIVLAISLSFSACGGGSNPADQKQSGAAKPAAAPAAPAPTPEPAPAAPAAASEVDLGAAGPAWAGFTVKAPAETKIADNGAGGAVVMVKGFQFDLSTEPFDAKLRKDGLQAGLEFSKGKITYTTDKDDELVWTTETPNADGAPLKGFGFALVVPAGDKKVTCFAALDSEEQLKAAREICTSLTKK